MASNGFVLGFRFEDLGIVSSFAEASEDRSDFGFRASDLSILISNFKFLWLVFTAPERAPLEEAQTETRLADRRGTGTNPR